MCQSTDVSRYSDRVALKASTTHPPKPGPVHLPRLTLSCRRAAHTSQIASIITEGTAGVQRLREASKLQDRKFTRIAHSRLVSSFTSDSSRRFSTLLGCQYSPEGPWHALEHLQPALVASRFNESSLSPFARTCPQKAKVVEVWSALPSASTSTILICTDA